MHINNPDALKTWLTEVLEPLCDADPAALARYVLALLKKDKPEKDLRDCMKEQLDVFLAHETEPFLERLFRSIKSEDYIKIVQAKEAAAAVAAAAVATAAAAAAEAAATLQQHTSSVGTVQSQSASTPDDTNNSSSKVRIKREFTPPLHENNNSNGKSSKDSAGIVSSGEKSSVTSSTNNNSSAVHETGNDLSSSASSGAISTPAANNNLVSSQNSSNASGKIPAKISSNKDEHNKESRNRGRRISNRSRSRSRSRSFERSRESRRSRSRDRGPLRGESNRDKANRQYRSNKSPVGRGGESFRSRYDRKNHGYENRRGGGSSGGGGGSSGASGGGASRTINRSQSGSRSPSPVVDRRKMARSESPVAAAAAAAAATASAAVSAPAMDHTPSGEPGPLNAKRQRCRDFDEKGYCMRGETCPWDHGVDPVVLEDINNPALITIQSAAQMRTGPIHPEYSPDAPELWNRPPNFPPGRPSIAQRLGNIAGVPGFGPRGGLSGSFRGVAPGFPTGFPGNPIGATPLQRELISVPVVDANKGGDVSAQQPKRRFEPEDAVAVADAHMKRKIPLNNRLGPRVTGHPAGNGGIVNPQHNCSLELRKIPRGLNAIAHLNNHFSKFGKIVNIQISYDGDPEAAIVTFSTHAEANVAYRSTEAVLNNRFIKVFWHSSPVGGEQPAITPGAKTEHSLRRSYPNQYSINNNLNISSAATTPTSVVSTVSKDGTPTAITSAATSMASGGENVAPTTTVVATHLTTATKLINTNTTPIVTANQLRMKNAAKINHAKSDLMRKTQEITQGLRKRKYDLLQGYLKELRTLVMMVEKFEAHDPSRAKLLSSIKELEGKIDKLKAEIASDQSQIVAQVAPKRKTKEQHEKEILDAELELIAQEQRTHRVPGSGNAPAPVVVSGAAPVSKPQLYGPQGVRAVRATNRVAPLGSTSVDRRPTTILITGFSLEDADALLGHFKHFGEITKHQLEETVPSLSITYSIRQNAEKALVRGKMFRDITLQTGWAVINNTNINNNATPVGAQVGTTESKEKASPVENASEAEGLSKVPTDTAEKMDEAVGENAGTVVGAETSSAASMDTLNETASMEETSEVQLVEEEEEEEDMESEDRSWRR